MGIIDDKKRRIQEIHDSAPRAATRLHSGAEPSSIPPPWNDLDMHIERTGQRTKNLHAIWIFVATVLAAGAGTGVYLYTRPSLEYVNEKVKAERDHADEIEKRRIEMALMLSKIEQKLDSKITEDDKRWNKLDSLLEKQFGDSTKTTPPAAYGPEAKSKGRK